MPLTQVADVSLVEGAAQISRDDTRRRIGGLITSTLLTLLIPPTLYAWFVRDPK